MGVQDQDRPYTQREVMNMLLRRLPAGKHSWLRDPEGNPAVQAYGTRSLPSQPLYVHYRPSVHRMQVRFTPRRISSTREAELWLSATAAGAPLRAAGVTARRQLGNTQETERDEQWVVTLPERLTDLGYSTLRDFVDLAASCMGLEAMEDD